MDSQGLELFSILKLTKQTITMKLKRFAFLLLIIFLVSCEKEIFTPSSYLKATINGNPFIVYQDNRLNNDNVPNTFSFSFGQIATKNADTCLFLSVCLNRNNLHISFPKPTGNVTYTIYRKSNISGQPSAFYSVVPESAKETGIETFHTQNILNIKNYEEQPIGEIIIDKIDVKSRLIKGRFTFSAYGYEVASTESYVPKNNVIGITRSEIEFAR